jgi:hypothetical protein
MDVSVPMRETRTSSAKGESQIGYFRIGQTTSGVAVQIDPSFQSVISGYLAVMSAGFIEQSICQILMEYARRRGDRKLQNFVSKTEERENSLNCEKFKKYSIGLTKIGGKICPENFLTKKNLQ